VLKNWREQTTAVERERSIIVANVFHHDGKPIRNFRNAWVSACKRAGLAGRLFHDFRRTAARNYRRQGVSEGVVMLIGGWKTRSLFDRYSYPQRKGPSRSRRDGRRKTDWEELGKNR
jgi:integrase